MVLTFVIEAQERVFVVVAVAGADVQGEILLGLVGGNLWGLAPLGSWAGVMGFPNDWYFYDSCDNVKIEDLEKKN